VQTQTLKRDSIDLVSQLFIDSAVSVMNPANISKLVYAMVNSSDLGNLTLPLPINLEMAKAKAELYNGVLNGSYAKYKRLEATLLTTQGVPYSNILPSDKRQASVSGNLAGGVIGTYFTFDAMIGDTICLNSYFNGSTSQYLTTYPYYLGVKVVDIEIIYPVTRSSIYGVNLQVKTDCFCHCAYSPKTSCHSDTDNCGGNPICVNTYRGDINDWSCPANFYEDGSVCCSSSVSEYDRVQSYKISSPSTITVVAEMTFVYFDNIYSKDWILAKANISVPFTTSLTTGNFYYGSATDQEFVFTGFISMNEVSNIFGDYDGDLIFQESDGEYKIANGWNQEFSTEVSTPGWLKFDDAGNPIYNRNSLANNLGVKVDNCLKDDFTYSVTVSQTKTEDLPDATEHLSKYGSVTYALSHGYIAIKPNSIQTVSIDMLLNVTTNYVVQLGALSGFSCKQVAINPVTLTCGLDSFVGSNICFGIKTIGNVIVTVSCGVPNNAMITLTFNIGQYTNSATYSICATGYQNTPCAQMVLNMLNGTTSNPDWVNNGTINYNPAGSIDDNNNWDFFGNVGSWFDNLDAGFKTIFTIAGFAVAGVVALIVLYCLFKFFVYFYYNRPKLMKYKKFRDFKRTKYEMDKKDLTEDKLDLGPHNGAHSFDDPEFWEM
jgi:hypothetical protein